MCGIAGGIVRAGERPSEERLAAMRDALLHRGPDDSGVVVVDNVGLVHTRLSIVDVSAHAHQPMWHPDGRLVLTFNGEIFNHQQIRSDLGDQKFVSSGDTETLVYALERWGPRVLDRLNGQFAFAALDLTGGRLLLARDRFGIKPLYLASTDEGIWFASEPAALIAAGVVPVPKKLGWETIVNWSCYRAEETLIAGITRVRPGSYLEFPLDTPGSSRQQWYALARRIDPVVQQRLAVRHRRSVVDEMASTLRSAVHDALLGDVPMGTLCSGGVDSSLITALAVELKPDLVAFSARHKSPGLLDEGAAANRVADSLKIELDMLEVTEQHWRSGFVNSTLHFGAPIATASSVTISQMAERARARGIKVLLTGEGADELFGGYWNPFGPPLKDFLPVGYRICRRLEPRLFGSLIPPREALMDRAGQILRSRFRSVTLPGDGPSGMRQEDEDVLKEMELAYSGHDGSRRDVEFALLRDFDFSLAHLLNRMDTNVMQASVEARVPFLDPRVVDLVLNLPLELRVGPWNKGILRDVARRVLPLRLAYRPKVYGMDYDAGVWIEQAADPAFLSDGMMRDSFEIPREQFSQLLTLARGALRVRLWSTEVWCRSVFAGESAAMIEKELWVNGP